MSSNASESFHFISLLIRLHTHLPLFKYFHLSLLLQSPLPLLLNLLFLLPQLLTYPPSWPTITLPITWMCDSDSYPTDSCFHHSLSNCPLEVREHSHDSHSSPLLAIETSGDHPFEQEDYCRLPGLTESDLGDNTLGVVLDSLLPSYKEVLSPIPLPTYMGITPYTLSDSDTGLEPSETRPNHSQKDYTWTRGHGLNTHR
jgi:hypothetical protein